MSTHTRPVPTRLAPYPYPKGSVANTPSDFHELQLSRATFQCSFGSTSPSFVNSLAPRSMYQKPILKRDGTTAAVSGKLLLAGVAGEVHCILPEPVALAGGTAELHLPQTYPQVTVKRLKIKRPTGCLSSNSGTSYSDRHCAKTKRYCSGGHPPRRSNHKQLHIRRTWMQHHSAACSN